VNEQPADDDARWIGVIRTMAAAAAHDAVKHLTGKMSDEDSAQAAIRRAETIRAIDAMRGRSDSAELLARLTEEFGTAAAVMEMEASNGNDLYPKGL